ncbi:MAG: T9SS type A sorting domain-containing protein [Candidatus Cloacimonetes bacterium]|nr:T9SS type A sorting domain-containing protein [Candidatus Cloacimonadota bacterium]
MDKSKFIICILFILLLSISIEATYHKIGHSGEPYWSRDLALVGSTLLVPDEAGIHIIDVSEPGNPVYIDCFYVTENCLMIEVSGNIAYIANAYDGLLILDVSNPQSPQFLGSYDTPDCALSLAVLDTIVYIADRNAGLQIIDVSDPPNPEFLGSLDSVHASHIRVFDTLVFITYYYGGFYIIDVSNPAYPTLVNGIENIPEDVNDIIIIDSIAYVTTSDGFLIYDFSDPTVFNLISTYETTYAGAILISQNMAYLSCGYSGYKVLDISDISEPELIGVLKTPMCARNAVIEDNIAYIMDLYTGLEIYDISEPENPNLVGSVDTPNFATSISISEDIAYVTDYDSYIRILDLSDPGFPYIINSYGIFYTVKDFLIVENYGYAITSHRLYIFRLDNLVYPEIISYIETDHDNKAIAYSNSHIYLASSSQGIKIINVNNPQNPYIVGECDTPGNAYDLVISGDIVYVADGYTGLIIIDASDLSNPFILPYLSTPSTPNNVSSLVKTDNILYLACNYDGLKVVDINNPTSPIFLLTIINRPDSKFKTKPIIINDKLIVEDRNWNEILTFDITVPANPELINTYIWNLSTRDWEVYEDYLVTVNGYNGVSILDLESITSINENQIVQPDIELNNYPNPFNPTTMISFSIPEASKVELSIYNIKGQKVKTLVNSKFIKGNHLIIWNGNDESGKQVASGVYFYKLKAGKYTKTKRMILIK